jgi:hypothetical protein
MNRFLFLPFSVIFLLATATADSLDPALAQAVAHRKATVGEAQKYAYIEHIKNVNWDSKGKETLNSTDTYEIIFLEGAPYRKHVLHNEQALSAKDQKAEDKKIQDLGEARRRNTDKHGLLSGNFHFELPLDRLASDFSVSALGTEQFDGRPTLVLSATPADMKQAVRNGLAYEMKLWVDQQDRVFRKIEAKVTGQGMRWEKDALISDEFAKINGEAWLPVRYWFKGNVRYLLHDVPVEHEQIYADYRKFRADVKITVPAQNQ